MMLSPLIRIARMVSRRRNTLQLSQRQVASQLGCSQAYLAQVETAKRPLSKRFAEKLEVLFKVKPGKYTQEVIRRGRPPLEAKRPRPRKASKKA